MEMLERKKHWENIFRIKDTRQVSWYQQKPETSLHIIELLELPQNAKIIDAGCGDGYLPDFLIQKGYSNITLVDIADHALNSIKERLGKNKIEYINADITNFVSIKKFDVWHDRAVFHFLNSEKDILKYVDTVNKHVKKGGFLIIGTFSNNGPTQCSGLDVHQYSEVQLTERFESTFNKIRCFSEDHRTPSGGSQNFLFCVFKKK
ncbi:methyltransferase domain-containing protein [Maribellus comscasis]|uniref:Methyltransferase domain-containing protein n=1 Tax=Maribellus comscasis TaxID=2681766 RepID=A0A6I6JJ76_9BACT|nr:class I SAM-dependent methyltransferase [Maribellus comscasis]QGY42321.1 methyltransferase domain-containing protein [Maribellus comscasis]